MPSAASSAERSPVEGADLPSLARALTAADGRVLVWKGGRDLSAAGDLDCAAPVAAWAALEAAFGAWAEEAGLAWTASCRHGVGMLILAAGDARAGAPIVQADLVDAKLVHGAPAWTATELLPHAELEQGVRLLRAGAEGVARLLVDPHDDLGRDLARRDPYGTQAARRALGARGAAVGAGRARLELVLAARAVLRPRSVARAVRSDGPRRRCPLLAALASGRAVPSGPDAWLAAVAAEHEVRRHA